MHGRMVTFISIIQAILFAVHWFVYATWTSFARPANTLGVSAAKIILLLLSVSFVISSVLAFRYSNILIRVFYTISAVWLGTLSFFFLAASLSWLTYAATALLGLPLHKQTIGLLFFALAACASVYAIINALWIRVRRISVKLPNLPESWRGRVAALVSDVHLGHVRGRGFMQRIVHMLLRLRPDVVFITGDLFDGTSANLERVTEPWVHLAPPLGAFFVAGNHEEFSGHSKYLDAVRASGIRVLENEKVSLDGLDLVGVHHGAAVHSEALRSILRKASLDPKRPSILLAHAPDQLRIAEEEGVSLQLSGHTHRGQFFPWTWITSRIYGPFVYGLKRLGRLLVYTTSGAGTWGPPMRLGAAPELVLIRFESELVAHSA
jgi:predicted MPP superfamily phosphohydrolase